MNLSDFYPKTVETINNKTTTVRLTGDANDTLYPTEKATADIVIPCVEGTTIVYKDGTYPA